MSAALSFRVADTASRFDASLSQDIHLDANANVAPTAGVIDSVLDALARGGNPSSVHSAGETGRQILACARDAVASLIEGALPENVVFTSGCTEANNQVVASARTLGAHLVTTVVEHPSLLRATEAYGASGGRVTLLPVDAQGLVQLADVVRVLERAEGPVFVSVQSANSETGVRQPWDQIAAIARQRPHTLLHADAAQAFGKLPLSLGPSGADVITVSGHKLHAPMGVGALIYAETEDRLRPLLLGGDQERGLRAGTEPLPLIAGFGRACLDRARDLADHVAQMAALRDALEAGLRRHLPSIRINGAGVPRSPNTSSICFPGVEAMALVAALDLEGVFASQGSACHSRRPEPSHVLTAMGLSEADAFASVRFSVSPLNTRDEIDAAVLVIAAAAQRLGVAS